MYRSKEGQALDRLLAPHRNNYYYGKLLDEYHLRMEQDYFIRKRWLLNRLGLGAGVLCGLEIRLDDDGKTLWVMPGVAINSLGQEIIVPEPVPLDPRRLTDECGGPSHPIESQDENPVVTICIAYRECYADYAPVLVSDCNDRDQCAPGTIIEGYCLLVHEGKPDPIARDEAICEKLSKAGVGDNGYDDLFKSLLQTCAVPPDDNCIPLAVVMLPADLDPKITEDDIDAYTYRPMIFSNQTLFEMILCLSDCCAETPTTALKRLELVAGDGQVAQPPGWMVKGLQVRVMQGNTPVPDEPVTFTVTAGGGHIGDDPATFSDHFTVNSGNTDPEKGLATLPYWKLQNKPNLPHLVTASITSGTPAFQFFSAALAEVPVEELILKPHSRLQQSGMAGAQVTEPPVVQVFKGGVLQDGVPVIFDVLEGGLISDDPANPPTTSVTTESGKQGVTGEAALPVWTLGIKDNRIQAHIITPDIPRECVFYAEGVQRPHSDDFLQVMGVEFFNYDVTTTPPTTTSIYRMKTPYEALIFERIDRMTGMRINQIRVTFNKELDAASLTTFIGAMSNPDKVSFLVKRPAGSPVQGFVELALNDTKVAVFTGGQAGDPAPFSPGEYEMTLFGYPGNSGHTVVRSIGTPGIVLDGERQTAPPWNPGEPFSGNGQEGGNFVLNFTIKQ